MNPKFYVLPQEKQRAILNASSHFLVAFIFAGFSFRFGWLMLPFTVSIIAAIVFLVAYAFYAEVLRENTYLPRTIEVQEDQKVIDTGLYGIRPASDVHGDGISVSCRAAGTGICNFFCDHDLLHTDYYGEHIRYCGATLQTFASRKGHKCEYLFAFTVQKNRQLGW